MISASSGESKHSSLELNSTTSHFSSSTLLPDEGLCSWTRWEKPTRSITFVHLLPMITTAPFSLSFDLHPMI